MRSRLPMIVAAFAVLLTAAPFAAEARARGLYYANYHDNAQLAVEAPRMFGEVPLDPELSPSIGYLLFTDSEMESTYRGLFLFGLESSVSLSRRSRFFLSAAYGTTSGDPFYDLDEFESGIESELDCLPFRAGLRLDLSEHSRFHLSLGAAWLFAWIRETVPESLFGDQVEYDDYTGIGQGFEFQILPQWRSQTGKTSVGVEFNLSNLTTDLDSGSRSHRVDMGGVLIRLAIGRRL